MTDRPPKVVVNEDLCSAYMDLEPDINDLSRMTELGLLAAERGDDEEDGE